MSWLAAVGPGADWRPPDNEQRQADIANSRIPPLEWPTNTAPAREKRKLALRLKYRNSNLRFTNHVPL